MSAVRAGAIRPPVFRPPVLDFAVTSIGDLSAIRSFLISTLATGKINPCFVVRNHPAIPMIHTFIEDARGDKIAAIASDPAQAEKQYSIVQDSPPIRASLNSLVSTFLTALCSTSAPPAVGDGLISLRYYPPVASFAPAPSASALPDLLADRPDIQRLGAHVDGNLMTLLLSTAAGLQVPTASINPSLTSDQVRNYGLPTLTGAILFLPDSHWSYVDVRSDEILVTLGNEFFDSGAIAFQEKPLVHGPVLHRVNDGLMNGEGRISVPFLAKLVQAAVVP
jgi:hypothetical protein